MTYARFLTTCFTTCARMENSLTIVIPYADAGRLTKYWAIAEERVDWERPGLETERCTVAFAATELHAYLARTVPSLEVRFSDYFLKDLYLIPATMEFKIPFFTLKVVLDKNQINLKEPNTLVP